MKYTRIIFILLSFCFIVLKGHSQVFDREELDNLYFVPKMILEKKINSATIEFNGINDSIEPKIYYQTFFNKNGAIEFCIQFYQNTKDKKYILDTSWFNGYDIHDCSFPYPEGYLVKKSCNSKKKIVFADNASCKTIYTYDTYDKKILNEFKSCFKGERADQKSKTQFIYNRLGSLCKLIVYKQSITQKCSLDSVQLPVDCYELDYYYLVDYKKEGLVSNVNKYSKGEIIESYRFIYNTDKLVSHIEIKNKKLSSIYSVYFRYNY